MAFVYEEKNDMITGLDNRIVVSDNDIVIADNGANSGIRWKFDVLDCPAYDTGRLRITVCHSLDSFSGTAT